MKQYALTALLDAGEELRHMKICHVAEELQLGARIDMLRQACDHRYPDGRQGWNELGDQCTICLETVEHT